MQSFPGSPGQAERGQGGAVYLFPQVFRVQIVRKTKSKGERGSTMRERHTPKIGEGSPSGLDHAV